VSREKKDAWQYPVFAKHVLEERGFRAWVWHCDRRASGYVLDEIMDAIEGCRFFFYIASKSSHKSRGQLFERRYAWDIGRDPAFVLAFSRDYISREHRVAIRNIVSDGSFENTCVKIAKELPRYQRVEEEVADVQEGHSL
jgi:hypothetical protein